MIEIAQTNDYKLLAEMNEEIQTFHHKAYPNIFKPYDKETIISFFKRILVEENSLAYIATENEIAIGYVLLFKISVGDNPFQYSRHYLLIDQILVLSNYQSKGVGRHLLQATFSYAKSCNIDIVALNHWTQNDLARKFFSKSGFEYYNEKMWKVIE